MISGFRKLIVIACLLIMAGGGYLAWEHYQRVYANAPPKGIVGQVACQLRLHDVKTSSPKLDDQPFLTNCLMGGYITKSDLDDAGLSP
ncbi:hypothetical protein [Rhizobium sp. BK377]|jgi:hypothetical protein|uniref:hypothetical protein n=1 Tax=Rhizobium sp. BK377 TaxID=2587058 RepID=UPI00161B09B7|nr:hypothetical protein [Rhizobium sp. BK377]MBB3464042.1 hypothetical protein [Rhizobium sp. BK377]